MVGEQEQVQQGQRLAEYLQVPLQPVKELHDTIIAEFSNPEGVLQATVAARIAASSPEVQLGVAPSLLTDPSRSAVRAARWQIQSGKMPEAVDGSPEAVLSLWAGEKEGIAPLKLPEGQADAMMALADKLEMRGGGPHIFAREEAASIPIDADTTLHVHGGARNANRERIETALEVIRHNSDYKLPIVATADHGRILNQAEREAVQAFAPNAETELELFLASAADKGFEPTKDLAKVFPDGTVLYTLKHTDPAIKVPLYVVAPQRGADEHGKPTTGLHNAYKTLLQNPALGGLGGNVLAVTSTHYGPMALVNNFKATHALNIEQQSVRVIGDNQPARAPQAHLIEAGLTIAALDELYIDPLVRAALAETVA